MFQDNKSFKVNPLKAALQIVVHKMSHCLPAWQLERGLPS